VPDSKLDVLPDSRAKTARGVISVKGTSYVPIYCANCGAPGGGVPAEHMTFAFYLCNGCCEKWGHVAGTYVEPDAVFFEKVKQAQLEEHGHLLNSEELAKVLSDPTTKLSKLVRDAPKGE
jgi:hypothetical protein